MALKKVSVERTHPLSVNSSKVRQDPSPARQDLDEPFLSSSVFVSGKFKSWTREGLV